MSNEGMKLQTRYEVPWTEGPTLFALDLSDWKFQQPAVDIDKCCHCGTCYIFCPTGCHEDKGTYFEPNIEYCKGCGICARECPSTAIAMKARK
jgi:2-oxoacid:acceptor oxidoreductase delta subunit (pyruvate/2-ketoisovalerate family)